MVALYDSEDVTRLLEVIVFDRAKGQTPTGTFTGSSNVKAYWWSGFDTLIPLCESADGTIAE